MIIWGFDGSDWSCNGGGYFCDWHIGCSIGGICQEEVLKKTLQPQNRLYLYQPLKACAERANTSAKDKRRSEWSVNDAADIIRCLVRVMEIIKQDSQQKEGNQALMLKQYFVNLLIMELYEEVHNGDAADSVFKSTEPTQVLDNLWSKWQQAIAFFDIWNYPVATEEDLAD